MKIILVCLPQVIESLKQNDTVLVKGSNSLNMKLIIEKIKDWIKLCYTIYYRNWTIIHNF